MSDVKPFWELDHPYHAPDGNYFANRFQMEGFYLEYETWDDFLAEMDDADEDYNFLYRWDFFPAYEGETVDVNSEDYDEDDYEPARPGELRFCYILQRKGNFLFAKIIDPKPEDEGRIRAYLETKWAHVKLTWAPIAQ